MEGRALVPAVFRSSLLTRLAYLLLIPHPGAAASGSSSLGGHRPDGPDVRSRDADGHCLQRPVRRSGAAGLARLRRGQAQRAPGCRTDGHRPRLRPSARYAALPGQLPVGVCHRRSRRHRQHLPPGSSHGPLRRPSARRASASPCSTWRGPGHCACSTPIGLVRPALPDASPWPPALRLDLLRGPFGVFILAYLAFYTFQYLPLPIFPIFWVRELHLTDGAIGLGSAPVLRGHDGHLACAAARDGSAWAPAPGACQFAAVCRLSVLDVAGAGRYAVLGRLGIWAAPYGGLLNGALVNRLMETVPDDDRPAHMAIHNLALNLGILLGSLLGPSLAAGSRPEGSDAGSGHPPAAGRRDPGAGRLTNSDLVLPRRAAAGRRHTCHPSPASAFASSRLIEAETSTCLIVAIDHGMTSPRFLPGLVRHRQARPGVDRRRRQRPDAWPRHGQGARAALPPCRPRWR